MAEERELAGEERAGSGKTRRWRSDSKGKPYSAEKPWGLVLLMVLGLALLGLYIGWLNAPDNTNGSDVLLYVFGNSEDKPAGDPSTTSSDSRTIWDGPPLKSTIPDPDSPGGSLWDTEPQDDLAPENSSPFLDDQPAAASPAPPTPLPVPEKLPAVVPSTNTEAPAGVKTYQIVVGKFKSKESAQIRIRELGQGNYPARLVEPISSDGFYEVMAGEFESYKRAKSKADEISFILELKATVQEKIR